MKLTIKKTEKVEGEATPPASKSHTIRGLIVGTLAKGTTVLKNSLRSQDTTDAIRACRTLGASITRTRDRIRITGTGVPVLGRGVVHTGNSGITTHFLMPMLGLRGTNAKPLVLECGKQMKTRTVAPLVQALRTLGLVISSKNNDNHCPLIISGELRGGKVSVSGKSSQYLSALLLSLPYVSRNSEVTVIDLEERPYVEMTEAYLREQGVVFTHTRTASRDRYIITGGQQYRPFVKTIPGDFSSASYLIAAGVLLGGTVTLRGLTMRDSQGDKALVSILRAMGADIRVNGETLIIRGGRSLRGTTIDANEIPDLVPTLAVIATQAEGETKITRVANVKIKETDRLHSMTEGLRRMGGSVVKKKDGLIIRKSSLIGSNVHGYNDHRTVMALSLAGMLASGKTVIDTAEAIEKTFPEYVKTMRSLGARMSLTN